jgi:hypothetical protein
MHRMNTFASTLLGVAVLGAATGFAVPIDRTRVVTGLAEAVTVETVKYDGRSIVGSLVNRSGYTITDVKVIASDSFRWADEQHPGADDPSRAATITIPGPLGPNELFTVQAPLPPRPERSDGYFVPRLEVVGLVRVESTRDQPAASR